MDDRTHRSIDSQTPPRLGMVAWSLPSRRSTVWMTPEWHTTTTHSAERVGAVCETTASSPWNTRAAISSAGSKPAGRRRAALQPGQSCSISAGVNPCHSPASASAKRASMTGAGTASCDAMIEAVSLARARLLDQIEPTGGSTWPRAVAAARACSRPSAVSGVSARPCQRRSAFHSLCPCRSINMVTESASITTQGIGDGTLGEMVRVRFFAAARDAAGTAHAELPGDTVADVLTAATQRYGDSFAAVLATCKIWVDGEPAIPDDSIGSAKELAVLPPVSGGSS